MLIESSVRGALNALGDPSYNTGLMLSYFLGSHLNCINQAKFHLIIPIVFIILLFLLPESPEFWINRKNKKVTYEHEYCFIILNYISKIYSNGF